MADNILYPEIWKKSFLLEIEYDTGTVESFIFSLPPEGVEETVSQRVTETKTYGGLFSDDYGIDIGKIHLSGTTGNSSVKKLFTSEQEVYMPSTNSNVEMTGREEIYYIRDKIARYKTSSKWQNSEKAATMKIYNLGANYDDTGGYGRMDTAVIDAWEVLLRDFKVSQNKATPFIHSYSIDFTAVRALGEKKMGVSKADSLVSNPPLTEMTELPLSNLETWYGNNGVPSNVLSSVEKYQRNETILDKISKVRAAIQKFDATVKKYRALVENTIENYMAEVLGIIHSAVDVYNTFKDATHAPADIALDIINKVKGLRVAVETAVIDTMNLPEQWSEEYGMVGQAAVSEWEAYKNYFEDNQQALENATNKAYVRSVSGANPEVTIVPSTVSLPERIDRRSTSVFNAGTTPDDSTPSTGDSLSAGDSGSVRSTGTASEGEVLVVVSYGYIAHTATSETTLEKLAQVYLGDPDKARVLALINHITGDDDISPGDQMQIPILTPNALNTLNHIFGPEIKRNTTGIDVALANGKMQIGANGDFVPKYDAENINQAINMRLTESVGRRIRLNTYGIRNVAGMNDTVAIAYISTSIKDTVMQDPRIESVFNLRFRSSGDSLFVSFDFTTNDGKPRRYEGGL
jgi:hypothetical protein